MTPLSNLDDAQHIDDRMRPAHSDTVWPPRRQRIPAGCDQQGRQPEAAHAASELVEADDLPQISAGVFIWPLVSTLGILAVLLVAHLWSMP